MHITARNVECSIRADLRIGWEELLGEPVDLKNYVGYLPQLANLRPKTPVLDELDDLLMAVSQQYEETCCTDEKLDELFLEASQLLVLLRVPDSHGHGSDTTASATALNAEVVGKPWEKVGLVCYREGQHTGASIIVKKFVCQRKCKATLSGLKMFGLSGPFTAPAEQRR